MGVAVVVHLYLLNDRFLVDGFWWLYKVLPSLDLAFLEWDLWWPWWFFVGRDPRWKIALAWLLCCNSGPYFLDISSFLFLLFLKLRRSNQGWGGSAFRSVGRRMLKFGRSLVLVRLEQLLRFHTSFKMEFPLLVFLPSFYRPIGCLGVLLAIAPLPPHVGF